MIWLVAYLLGLVFSLGYFDEDGASVKEGWIASIFWPFALVFSLGADVCRWSKR